MYKTQSIKFADLKRVAESDCNYYVILQAMRNYCQMTVSDVTDALAHTSEHSDYYRLNPENIYAFNEDRKSDLATYLSRMQTKVDKSHKHHSAEFAAIGKIVKDKYSEAYEKNHKISRSEQAKIDQRNRVAEDRQAMIDFMPHLNNLHDLLTLLRTYFELSQPDIGKIANPEKPLSKARIEQFENKDHKQGVTEHNTGVTSIPKPEYLKNIVIHYRALAVTDKYSAHSQQLILQIDRLRLLAHEALLERGTRSIYKVKEFADKDSNEFGPYLNYLVLESGHSVSSVGLTKTILEKGLPFGSYKRIIDALHEPIEPHGRRITIREFIKLDRLYVDYIGNFPTKKETVYVARHALEPVKKNWVATIFAFDDLVKQEFGEDKKWTNEVDIDVRTSNPWKRE